MPNNLKRSTPMDDEPTGAFITLPVIDHNGWYYPSHGYESDEEPLDVSVPGGNWGNKTSRDSRWVRRGKIAAWGPGMDEWQAEERARKRIRLLLPASLRSPSPPCLPHLRDPSPPLESPYPPPNLQHLSYSSYVMDKAITQSFRSALPEELEQVTNTLVEGEATLRRALGRLWQVISEDPDEQYGIGEATLLPKREDDEVYADAEDERERRILAAPDLTPAAHKHFLDPYQEPYANGAGPPVQEPSQFASHEAQAEGLEKSLATLRELQDDGREYLERLEEIREGLGEIRETRDAIWRLIRERALEELQAEL